ncbi:MAG: ATP-binding cassette domain-containing protein, partial [Armatimonadetes bacterium]|nr:ATP-binding cassette domain-containing protein [Armatimonadota bacterium]
MSQPVLKLDKATIRFGGLLAVDTVSFELKKGVLFGLIGPNGAGKTTVFNIVTGVYAPTSGDILFQGENINGLAPHKIARKGICRTFQNIRLFKTLSVLDNVVVGGFLRHKTSL